MLGNLYVFMQRIFDARVDNHVYPFLLCGLLFEELQSPEIVCVNKLVNLVLYLSV